MHEESCSASVWLKMAMTHGRARLYYMYRSITEIEKFTCCPTHEFSCYWYCWFSTRRLLLFCTFPELNHSKRHWNVIRNIACNFTIWQNNSLGYLGQMTIFPSFTNENFMFCRNRCCYWIVDFNKFEYESTKFWLHSINLHLINSSFASRPLHSGTHWNGDSLDEIFKRCKNYFSVI